MMKFNRYPHVKDILEYYALDLKDTIVGNILKNGIREEKEAEALSKFIWRMADKMSADANIKKKVLGRQDNREMLADIEYEVTSNIEDSGFMSIWDRVSDQENP